MFWPAFLSLTAVGLAGILAFAATAPQRILDQIPIEGVLRKRLLIAAQPAVLLVVFAAAGSAVADAVSSKSLIVDAVRGEALAKGWIAPIIVFLAVGLVAGAFLYLVDRWWKPWWGDHEDTDLITDWKAGSLVAGVTYGGLTEEVLMRWGIMGIVLWGLAAVVGETGDPGPAIATVAILISALLFAAGHLPAALIGETRTGRFIVRIIALNTIAGLLFGWLFWQWNLETAMAAHAGFHIGAAMLVLVLRRTGGAQRA